MSNSAQKQRRGAIGVIVGHEERFLVIERSATVRAPGKYCFPGGEIELNETEQQAVKRELQEELGLVIEPIRRVWQSATRSGVLLNWWLSHLPQAQIPSPNEEVARFCWMTLEEIKTHPKMLFTNRQFAIGVTSGEIDIFTT